MSELRFAYLGLSMFGIIVAGVVMVFSAAIWAVWSNPTPLTLGWAGLGFIAAGMIFVSIVISWERHWKQSAREDRP